MFRDSAPLKSDCNEQDRWRSRLDEDDLVGGMTNLDVDDREHQMEEQPLEKR